MNSKIVDLGNSKWLQERERERERERVTVNVLFINRQLSTRACVQDRNARVLLPCNPDTWSFLVFRLTSRHIMSSFHFDDILHPNTFLFWRTFCCTHVWSFHIYSKQHSWHAIKNFLGIPIFWSIISLTLVTIVFLFRVTFNSVIYLLQGVRSRSMSLKVYL
jgi:hypothetical protein